MATKTLHIPVVIPDEDVQLFKNNDHWGKFRQGILAYNGKELTVSEEELFTYAIFHEWTNEEGWRTYKDLARKLPNRRIKFEEYIERKIDNIKLSHPPINDIIESFGVAASLALSAAILGLNNADFQKIPQTSIKKTLDYEIMLEASDGKSIFQVESKGTHDASSLAKHKSSIRAKKQVQRKVPAAHKTILLGVICDLQYHRIGKPTQLYLLDPPADTTDRDPKKIQLINRLSYYLSELQHISRGTLAIALSNRLKVLKSLRNEWKALDKVPLVNQFGYQVEIYDYFAERINFLDGNKAHGRIYDLRLTSEVLREKSLDYIISLPQKLYFRGLCSEVINALAAQDFEKLLKFNFGREDLKIDSWDSIGALEQLPSGLIVGIFKHDKWNKTKLPELLKKL